MWSATCFHNALRAFFAGIVWAVVAAVDGSYGGNPLFIPVIMPLGYFTVYVPAVLLVKAGSSVYPFMNGVERLMALFIAPGDPFVFLLNTAKPDLVPVERPRFFSLQTIIFVLSPSEEERQHSNGDSNGDKEGVSTEHTDY